MTKGYRKALQRKVRREYQKKWYLENKDKIAEQRRLKRSGSESRKNRVWGSIHDDNTIMYKVKQVIDSFTSQGIIPTLRAVHYRAYSFEIIHNTKSDYTQLSDHTARAREKGDLPMDCFADDTRQVIYDFPVEYDYWGPKDWVLGHIDQLKNITQYYPKKVPRWLNQPNHVEIWIEKKALTRTFKSIIGDRQVIIVPGGGYHSVSYLNDNCERLRRFQDLKDKKNTYILYFGDVDPTGEMIEEVLDEKLSEYGVHGINFKRIALTDEQIQEFVLPDKPDAKTLKKLKRDTNAPRFMERHGGKLYQIEVDALIGKKPNEFKDMLIGIIDQLFDDKIYQEVLKKHSDKSLNELVSKRMKFLDHDENDK